MQKSIGEARKIFFLDFEASSLSDESFPIEIGWVDEAGQGESWLITPAEHWTEWSTDSERVHGISRSVLNQHGSPFRTVAKRAESVLGAEHVLVFADQPAYGGYWFRVLMKAAGLPAIPVLDVMQLYGEACRPLLSRSRNPQQSVQRAHEIVAAAENTESALPRTRHRALSDAKGLWWTWREIQRLVADEISIIE
jgi:hypothetical protein